MPQQRINLCSLRPSWFSNQRVFSWNNPACALSPPGPGQTRSLWPAKQQPRGHYGNGTLRVKDRKNLCWTLAAERSTSERFQKETRHRWWVSTPNLLRQNVRIRTHKCAVATLASKYHQFILNGYLLGDKRGFLCQWDLWCFINYSDLFPL